MSAVAPLGPEADLDSRFYWDGLANHQLLVQRCPACGEHRFPPLPACPTCGAPGGNVVAVAARGRVYSWIVVHRALVDRVRRPGPLHGGRRRARRGRAASWAASSGDAAVAAEQPVEGIYLDHGDWTELRFRAT